MTEYVQCHVCGDQVDPSVPKAFCGFCSVTPGPSCPWTKPAAATTLFFFGLHAAGLPLDLVPTDLPHELEHIEQSSSSSALPLGFGTTVQVMGTSTSTLPPGVQSFPEILQWPQRPKDNAVSSMLALLQSAADNEG